MSDYIEQVFGPGGLLASRFPGYEMREGQVALARLVDRAMREGKHALGEGPCGCHVAGQEILLFDGTIRHVEDIEVGDLLMGPDGMPRVVLALARGEQETAEIRPIKGQPWRVNLDHILTLVRIDNDRVVDVRVRDWLQWSRTQKRLHKLFRVGVPFAGPKWSLPLDPYFLGILLGDGCLSAGNGIAVTKPDPEIVATATEQAHIHGLHLRTKGITHHLVGPVGIKRHPIGEPLRGLGLYPIRCEEKFIPAIYKTASIEDRLALLAGLIDTDGSLTGGACYDFISKSRRLVEDLTFVARSVGLAGYPTPCRKTWQGENSGTYFRVCVSGDTHRIPCRIPRKRAPQRRQTKSVLRTGFEVVSTGVVEPYFGFSLSGEGRYLLGDFTVTHNTGKGVAYGVPAVWHTCHQKKRVVIATANIALQEQLVEKDLPLLAGVLPWRFSFAMLKGRSNYLCLSRLRDAEARGEFSGLFDDEPSRQAEAVLDWAETTETGDVSELPFVPLPQVWSRASVSADECIGEECPFRGQCFAERARDLALGADIVVSNYHLLFAHLAVRRETGMALVLPAHDLLVCDEAHEAAEIARDFFGFSVSERTVKLLAHRAGELGDRELSDRLKGEADDVFDAVSAFARSPGYRCRLRRPGFVDAAELCGALRSLAVLGKWAEQDATRDQAERTKARNVARLAHLAAAHIEEAAFQADEGKVYWIETDAKGRVRLRAKPIDVSGLLRDELFGATRSVTMVSATLTAGGSFGFVRRELGVPEGALELVAESPFDFGSQALLVVPEGLPDPREPEFAQAAAAAVARVMDLCGGRTLGLFTSYKNLNAVYEQVSGNGHRVLRQGDLPRAELARVFKQDVRSVLLGTESFWTGIDVPGEALTGLVIDKLPFPHPEDPVVNAICERDRQAFFTYMVPRAIIALRQGVGRLIRSRRDVGVVVLLDRRVAEMRYGRRFLQSLPRMMTTRKLDNIPRFLEEAAHAGSS